MQILVEHSGYDLLNTGDAAMLQAALERITRRWPNAEVAVVSNSPERLSLLSPGALPLRAGLADRPGYRLLPRRVRLGGGQAYKTLSPLLPIRSKSRRSPRPASLREAIRTSDLVIAAGGGYLCDPFWWHGAGVLSTLRAAQMLGRPTAMFGQGIGPLTHPVLKTLLRSVAPGLDLLTLREGIAGPAVLSQLGFTHLEDDDRCGDGGFRLGAGTRGYVTGDDALSLALALREDIAALRADQPQQLGVNLRISGYAGLSRGVSDSFALTMCDVATELGCELRALPVSHYEVDNDLDAVKRIFRDADQAVDRPMPRLIASDISTPEQLATITGACIAVVTGSYHAAVFALAAGVPTVAMTASSYYDLKFQGLAGLYPQLLRIVRLDQSDLRGQLSSAVRAAVAVPEEARQHGRQRSQQLVARAEESFEWLAERVDAGVKHGEWSR